ncbi:hypothetical protein Zmor_003891 [Zophobas morio]|uniref:Uncharacterized protein n=1 Tax=Zophobas morio TaxID=2755281 RepID=A0AA38LZK6_9CUCU|nr:hypothetical protein Zmor_003891 [Zophobas morio]
MGENVYNYLVGTKHSEENGTQYLINHLDKPDGNKVTYAQDLLDDYGYGYMDYVDADGVKHENNKLKIISSDNDGLFGKLINQIGSLKYHGNYNLYTSVAVENDKTVSVYRINDMGTSDQIEEHIGMKSLTANGKYDNNQTYEDINTGKTVTGFTGCPLSGSETFLLTDNDFVQMLKNVTELYTLTRNVMDEKTFGEMASSEGIINNMPGYVKTIATMLKLNLDSKSAPSFMDFMFKVLSGSISYDGQIKNDSLSNNAKNKEIANEASDVSSLFENESFNTNGIDKLVAAISKISPKDNAYNGELNEEYREAVREALGVKREGNNFS